MKTKSTLRSLLLAATSSLLAVSSANAQTVWNGSVDNKWSSAGNWNSALPSPNGGNLTFTGTANPTNTNDAGITSIGTLTLSNGGWDIDLNGTVTMTAINATDSSKLRGNVTFANGSPRTITLNGTSTTLEITGQLNLSRANNVLDLQVNGAGNTLLVGSLTMGASNGNKTISGTANVTVSGAVTEGMAATSAFVKTGAGTLTLNGIYTSDSLTTVSGGTFTLNGSISRSVMTISGGAVNGTGTLNFNVLGNAVLSLQHSGDVDINDTWTTVAVPNTTPGGPVNGVTFSVTVNGLNANFNDVVATISSSEAVANKLFARLLAEKP